MYKVTNLRLTLNKTNRTLILFLFLFQVQIFNAQGNRDKVLNYIKTHQEKAIEQMILFKIPASVIMAQAIKESGYGKSLLSQKSNNHFGIKCHKEWGGGSFIMDDDSINECFRSYKTIEDSFYDHSMFLKSRPRYAFLFQIPVTDYTAWCIGLKIAGYATDPHYADQLLYIIEIYNLYELDKITPLCKKSNYNQLLAFPEKNIIPINQNYFEKAEKHILAEVIFNIIKNDEKPLLVRGNSPVKNSD